MNRVDHIGIVVDSIDDAVAFMHDVLGLDEVDQVNRNGIRAVFFACGPVEIEVVEFKDDSERRRRLGEGSLGRIDHIAMRVDDIDEAYNALKARDVRLQGAPKKAERYWAFWTIPETSDGILYQFVERLPLREIQQEREER